LPFVVLTKKGPIEKILDFLNKKEPLAGLVGALIKKRVEVRGHFVSGYGAGLGLGL